MRTASPAVVASMLFLLVLSTSSASADVIQGLYHAYWMTVPLPAQVVQNMLADGLNLATPDRRGLPEGNHPVVLELGREYNSGPIGLSFLQTNFFEAKFEVPWVTVTGKPEAPPSTSKLVIFVDSTINSIASRLLYGLDARRADQMEMSSAAYVIGTSAGKFVTNVTRTGTCGRLSDFPEFQWYQDIMSQRWFGRQPSRCAEHHYQFSTAQLCPVTATLTSAPNVLDPHFPAGPLSVPSIRDPLGAVEVLVNFTMTLPCAC